MQRHKTTHCQHRQRRNLSRRSMPSSMPSLIAAVVLTMITAVGCSAVRQSADQLVDGMPSLNWSQTNTRTNSKTGRTVGPTRVITDASALALELPESDIQHRQAFAARFNSLVEDQRIVAANILVARNPDHAIAVLMQSLGSGNAEPDSNTLHLATAADQFRASPNNLRSLVENGSDEAVRGYFQLRQQMMSSITNGDFAPTGDIDLVATATSAGHPALLVDAYYQNGIAALMRQENSVAAESFRNCTMQAGDNHGVKAADAMLMCSESLRRAKDYAGAIAAWQQSVATACRIIKTRSCTSTEYWERAKYLRPVETPWPPCVSKTFQALGNSGPGPLRTDLLQQLASLQDPAIPAGCWLHAALGSWHHARGNAETALLHLKQSETQSTSNPSATDWLRIAQSPLLTQLGKTGTATTLLTPIIAREDNSPVMLAAISQMGTIKLTSGSARHGVRLLKRGVIDNDGVTWPGQTAARADYALGMLIIGEHAEGISQLHQAQSHFQSQGEIEQLAKSLFNEREYLKQRDDEPSRISDITGRITALQL
ncbi:MAG: hypothetical protein AAFP90_05500 [Planctomycetota bacterium]